MNSALITIFLLGVAAEEPASQPAKEEPASQPASQPAKEEPASQPASQPATEEPASQPAKEEPASQPAKEEPASQPAKEEPATHSNAVDNHKPPFLKGELTNLGTVQLLTHENAVAVVLGVSQIEEKFFALVRPELHLNQGKFSLGLAAPLRFEVVDLGAFGRQESPFANAGAIRAEDWDQIEDWIKPLRYLTWGRKEDKLYVDLNRIHAITLGHGQLIRRYSPTIDIDEDNLFAEVDAYSDFGGAELLGGPFPIPRLMGGLLFIKPLGFLDQTWAKSLSIGASYVVDLNVPAELVKSQNPADNRQQIPVLDDNELFFEGVEDFTGHRVQAFGIDGEIKVYKDTHYDVKVYGDWSTLIFPEAEMQFEPDLEAFTSSGITVGTIVRMSFGEKPADEGHSERHKKPAGARDSHAEDGHDLAHHATEDTVHLVPEHSLRIRVEGRVFDAGYLPSYFDAFYEADKFQFELGGTDQNARAALPTKWSYLHNLRNRERRIGAYLEASYLMPGWFGATLAYEDAFAVDFSEPGVKAARNLALHLETNHTEWLKAFVTYHYRHFDDVTKIFQFNTDNQVLYFGAKAKLLPFLFVHVATQRAFRVGFGDDDTAFNKRALDPNDPESEEFRFTSVGFQNEWATDVQVELGWVW